VEWEGPREPGPGNLVWEGPGDQGMWYGRALILSLSRHDQIQDLHTVLSD
jgi:hypothetical protein